MAHNGGDLSSRLMCSNKPNCVSSVAKRKSQYLAPIAYATTKVEAKNALLEMLRKNPHVEFVKSQQDYVHVTFTTKFFQFVDDVEFIIDDIHKEIHFRSKSRLGYYDFGANRKRMIAIKKILAPSLS